MELSPNFNDYWWWWPFMAMQLCSYWWWSWSWTSGDIVTCQEKSLLSTIKPRCNSDDDDELTFKMSICLIPRINLDMQFKFSCGGKLTKAYICTSTGPPSNIHVHFSRDFSLDPQVVTPLHTMIKSSFTIHLNQKEYKFQPANILNEHFGQCIWLLPLAWKLFLSYANIGCKLNSTQLSFA